MLKEEIAKLIEKTVKDLQKKKKLVLVKIPNIVINYSKEKIYGDYATNIALQLAKIINRNPVEIADLLASNLQKPLSNLFQKIEAVKPGFINFFVSKEYLQNQITEILKRKEKFGSLKIGENEKVNVEFISANPTGPLTLGNGRGGFCGDVLANVLGKAGYKVTREYYINDVGEQIRKLGLSIKNPEELFYKGDYIEDLREKGIAWEALGEEVIGYKAAQRILKEMIKPTVKKMGINFGVWFSEKNLCQKKEVDKILDWLKEKKLTYEKEGALWFKSTKFGDDKDRVLIKADEETTYFLSDIVYLKNKFKRGFKKLVFFWGADHHGYVGRMKAAILALGYKKEQADFIIMQLVRLFKKGKQARMSKRIGIYVTLDELIDEVGLDVARFFFLTRNPGSHLNFDLDLAKEKSEKNPVYYVQYAHARICSILRKTKASKSQSLSLKLLDHPSELELMEQLIRLPEIVEDTAKDYQVQRIPQYAIDLTTAFHQFYENCKVLSEAEGLRNARLSLVLATKIVLKSTLDLMGISAPEKM